MDPVTHKSSFTSYLREIDTYLQDHSINIKSLRQSITISKDRLNSLRYQIVSDGFKSEASEIHFFKHIKSLPLSHLIYFLKVQKFLQNSPLLLKEAKHKFIIRKMAYLNRFHKKHTAFIEYIKQEQTHLDSLYFTRSNAHLSPNKQSTISDPEFSTSHDYLQAKYQASLLYGRYLTHQLSVLEQKESTKYLNGERIKWTGSKVDLIELIYALHSSGVIDHGNSSVKKIASYFEAQFNCPLGDYYRSYSELRYRKKSRTKFLDLLSEQLQKKMDQDDA